MEENQQPVFLQRESYLRRRLSDAACIIPFFGVILLVLPAFWANESRTAAAMIYVFTVWALLIFAVGVISRRLRDRALGEETREAKLDGQEH